MGPFFFMLYYVTHTSNRYSKLAYYRKLSVFGRFFLIIQSLTVFHLIYYQ